MCRPPGEQRHRHGWCFPGATASCCGGCTRRRAPHTSRDCNGKRGLWACQPRKDSDCKRGPFNSSRPSRGQACPAPALPSQWRSGTCTPAAPRAWTAEAGRRGRHVWATLLGAAGEGRLGGTGELAGRAWHAKKGLANKSNKRVEQHWHKVEGLPALFDCTLCGWSTAESPTTDAWRSRAHRGHVVVCQGPAIGHALPRVDQLQVFPLLHDAAWWWVGVGDRGWGWVGWGVRALAGPGNGWPSRVFLASWLAHTPAESQQDLTEGLYL